MPDNEVHYHRDHFTHLDDGEYEKQKKLIEAEGQVFAPRPHTIENPEYVHRRRFGLKYVFTLGRDENGKVLRLHFNKLNPYRPGFFMLSRNGRAFAIAAPKAMIRFFENQAQIMYTPRPASPAMNALHWIMRTLRLQRPMPKPVPRILIVPAPVARALYQINAPAPQ